MSSYRMAVPILMYHEVAARTDTTSRLAVPPEVFAAQLAHLHAARYHPITMSALAAGLAGRGELPGRPVALTFDDGFADFHETALPLLQQYGFVATVFVTTGWIEDAGPAARPRPARMLTWQQVLEVAAAGVEIGAHSHTHPELDQLRAAQLNRELRDSKSLLEDRLGGSVPALAYPFGYSNARVRHAARAAGYEHACAVGKAITGPGGDLFALPRLTVRRSTGLRTFDRMVRGQYVPMIFSKERALTRGWAMVRRTRAAVRHVAGLT
jgi:peptidoglycan/xylan/chitin deacetylase (PgdA/CDA1 family)